MSNISWNPTEHTVMSTLQRISCFMGVKTISYFALRRFALGSLPTANYDDIITLILIYTIIKTRGDVKTKLS